MCPSTGQFSMRGSSSAQPVPIRSFCPCALLPVEAFGPSAAGLSRDKFVDLWRSFDGIDRIRAVPGQEQHFRLAKEYWKHFDGMGNGPKPQFPVPSMQLPPPGERWGSMQVTASWTRPNSASCMPICVAPASTWKVFRQRAC